MRAHPDADCSYSCARIRSWTRGLLLGPARCQFDRSNYPCLMAYSAASTNALAIRSLFQEAISARP